jgi:choline dehydrogenase-like flavoprotein
MLDDITGKVWDVVVIGTGIGGGTLGRSLAEKGFSVLFLEKGPFSPHSAAEFPAGDIDDPDARLQQGSWPTPLKSTINGRSTSFYGGIGAGVGGSSVFYAATLERPERHDVDHTTQHRHPTGGWPVSYNAFRPYFAAAERLYSIRGSADPLSPEMGEDLLPPIPLDAANKAMMDSLTRQGLHPYNLHLAVKHVPDCTLCLGHKCPRSCKMDGRSAGVEPALKTGNACVLDMCAVQALWSESDYVTQVEARRSGQTIRLNGRAYVLAAGALSSPRLLLASRSDHWPNGLANRSGLVGKNLMFHLTEMVAVWPDRSVKASTPTRAVALRDFYKTETQRFGVFQAMGINAGYGEIVTYLLNVFDRSLLRKLRLLRPLLRIPAYIGTLIFGPAKIFAGIMEDFPYEANQVVYDPNDPERIVFKYTISDELRARRAEFRKLIKTGLKGLRTAFLNFQPELNFAHACGTLRFGNDPQTSVLNPDCRAHDVTNLYVADASFMPTSTGTNPSLIIAANALRVADHIAVQLSR